MKRKEIDSSSMIILNNFIAGLTILSILITIIASAIAEARIITICYRATLIFLILWAVGSIVKRYWKSIIIGSKDKA